MMAYKKIFLMALAVGALAGGVSRRAEATPISPPTSFSLSDIASSGAFTYSFLVGDITYSFESCTGNGCTSSNVVLGVPASPSTGPGGGIIIQSVSGLSNNVLPAPGAGNTSDITLKWYASTSGNQLTAATGSAVGGVGTSGIGSASGGGTSLSTYNSTTTNFDPLHSVNMTTSGGPDIQPFPTLLNNVAGITDISASGTGYLNNGSIFLSEVPEPASLVLLLSALGGLGVVRRRRAGTA